MDQLFGTLLRLAVFGRQDDAECFVNNEVRLEMNAAVKHRQGLPEQPTALKRGCRQPGAEPGERRRLAAVCVLEDPLPCGGEAIMNVGIEPLRLSERLADVSQGLPL